MIHVPKDIHVIGAFCKEDQKHVGEEAKTEVGDGHDVTLNDVFSL